MIMVPRHRGDRQAKYPLLNQPKRQQRNLKKRHEAGRPCTKPNASSGSERLVWLKSISERLDKGKSRSHEATQQLDGKALTTPAPLTGESDRLDLTKADGIWPAGLRHPNTSGREKRSTRSQVATGVRSAHPTDTSTPQVTSKLKALDTSPSSQTASGRPCISHTASARTG